MFEYDENGNFVTNPKYTEIIRLHEMLEEAGIPHTFEKMFDGYQVCYPVHRNDYHCVMDAIEHHGSYGCDEDLLEIMGLLTPEEEENYSVLGFLTAENVLNRIKAHYEQQEEA